MQCLVSLWRTLSVECRPQLGTRPVLSAEESDPVLRGFVAPRRSTCGSLSCLLLLSSALGFPHRPSNEAPPPRLRPWSRVGRRCRLHGLSAQLRRTSIRITGKNKHFVF